MIGDSRRHVPSTVASPVEMLDVSDAREHDSEAARPISRTVQELLERHGLAGTVGHAVGQRANGTAAAPFVQVEGGGGERHPAAGGWEPRVSNRATDENGNEEDALSVASSTDGETEELAKLRCASVRTEVIAEKFRRKNRCSDYPGFAFGSSVFSSDTMMKFSIIKNELHNIMNNQLKRVRRL